MEAAKPVKRQCMGGETTESCWLEPSVLSLFPVFSIFLSRAYLVSVQTKPGTCTIDLGALAKVPIIFLRQIMSHNALLSLCCHLRYLCNKSNGIRGLQYNMY
ncbi:hypothetical protein V6N13_131951 [Hibiscus sabdariffa]|uniref:Uncharacterized protein n=2 Tax=Hibiscus sabdariffa TaxID=183260 RepID=A0ABR2B0L8_9ROSI